MRVLLVILLYICHTYLTDSAATCGTSTHTFTDTDILSTTTIQCVDATDLSTYPNNTIQWYGDIETFSSTNNDLPIQTIVTPGVNQLMCDFTLNSTDATSEVTTCSFTVTVYSLPTLSTSPSITSITYPSSDTITCTDTGGFDTPTLTWEDTSGNVLSSNSVLNFNNNELLIGDDKEFVCVSVNSAGQTNTSITVTVKPNPPAVTLTPPSLSVFVGDPTTLTCSATTSGLTSTAFVYSWFKDSSPITNGVNNVVITDNELTIPDTRTANQGLYRCNVTIYNSDPGSDDTQLTVTSRPPLVTITRQPTESTYIENDMLTLTCVVTPLPSDNIDPVSITWSSSTGMISGSNGETLTFQSLSVTDAGVITCSATVGNSEVTSSTFSLDIVPPAPTVTLTASTLIAILGEDVTLTCDVTNNSATTQPLSITWLRDMVEVTGESNPTLVITNLTLSDTAGYTCTVSIHGSENTTSNVLEVMVQSEIPQIAPLPTSNTVIEGLTIGSLDCNATGIPSPDVTWKDMNGSTYANPLNFMLLTNQMNGTFTCIATNSAGSDSEQIVITIIPPVPILSVSLSELNPILDMSFTLTCDVSNSLPDGLSLSDYSFDWSSSSSPVSVSTQQSYTFTARQSSEGMVYMCSASVAGSDIGYASSGVLMLQTVPTDIDFTIPDIVYIGQSLTVTCVGEGIPDPTAVINDQAGTTVPSTSGVVDLNTFTQSDNGTTETYICIVTNTHGMMSMSQTFVVLQPSIDIDFFSDPTTITKGNAVTLSCSVETDPVISLVGATYTFHTNEGQLGNGQVSADGSSATYSIAEYTNDEASFICKVSIQNGRLLVEKTLTVPTLDFLVIVAGGVSFVVIILLLGLVSLTSIVIFCCLRQRKRDKDPKNYYIL